jgi:dephospho-CoA kinase
MTPRPIVLGLTGSIGMGKSTVAAMFAACGVPVFDADATVHQLQGPDGEAVAAIEAAFPDTTTRLGVNRTLLREAVMADPTAFARLEAILHPAVAAAREAFLDANRGAPLVVLDVPLLFEAGGWRHVDKIAVVSAPAAVQRARVLARPGMTPERFEAILARQMPDAEKRARADFVIPTDGAVGGTMEAVQRLVACLSARGGG